MDARDALLDTALKSTAAEWGQLAGRTEALDLESLRNELRLRAVHAVQIAAYFDAVYREKYHHEAVREANAAGQATARKLGFTRPSDFLLTI